MNDSTISAVQPSLPQTTNAAPVVVKIDSLPPDLQANTVISGQVVSTGNNQTTLKTDQGLVVLQTALNIDVGQQVNIKIQPLPPSNSTQTITQNFVAELLNVAPDKVVSADNPFLRPPVIDANQPVTNQIPVDPVIVHDANAYEEYKPLQALVLQMPDILNDDTLQVMAKSLMNLPMQQPLPPGLQEGFSKFEQLVTLLSQANLFPTNTIGTAQTETGVQQNIISTLQQLLQPIAGNAIQNNPLLGQEPHQFIQLQTIQPGENLSPDILVNIRDQLVTLLKPLQSSQGQMIAPTLPMEKPETGLQSLVPQRISTLWEKTSDKLASLPKLSGLFSTPSMPSTPAQTKPQGLYTLPAIGLVLGLSPIKTPQLGQANLVLMMTPLKQDLAAGGTAPQQLIALLAPQGEQEEMHAPLLPGTLIVAALKPQTQSVTSFNVLPKELVPQILENFPALHPSLGDTWPALEALMTQITAQADAQPTMQAAIQHILPTPSSQQLPPAMLFFLSVIKNDFTSDWIPQKHLAALENIDKAALAKAIAQDLQAIRARMEDAAPSDSWRPLPLPLQVGDQLMRLQWFYRHPEDSYERSSEQDREGVHKKRKTRFLLNVPKTSVGDIQIDGLVQEKNLDLILRTETMLASHMETAIRGRYTAVLETTGMVGGINFQSGRDHYVHV